MFETGKVLASRKKPVGRKGKKRRGTSPEGETLPISREGVPKGGETAFLVNPEGRRKSAPMEKSQRIC